MRRPPSTTGRPSSSAWSALEAGEATFGELHRELEARLDALVGAINGFTTRLSRHQAVLQRFVAEGQSWAHLDIAGPSFNADAPWGHVGKGGTGAGVTTLVRYLRDRA